MSSNTINGNSSLRPFQFHSSSSALGSPEAAPEPEDRVEVGRGTAPASHGKSLLAAGGAALMAAMAIGGGFAAPAFAAAPAPTVQVMAAPAASSTLNTSDSARQANVNPALLSDAAAQQVLGQMPGLKDPSFAGGFSRFFGFGKFDAAKAVQKLDSNNEVQATRPGTTDTLDAFKNKDQLAELAVMRGIYPNSGVSAGIVQAFQTVGNAGGFSQDGQGRTAYQAFDALRHGQAVDAQVGGQDYTVTTPAQVQELNGLEGHGQDNPLAPATSSLLKKMAEGTSGEGLVQNGNRLNAYQYLQAAEAGQGGISYNFTGGRYHEALSVPVAHFGDLAKASQTAANQHAADAVRPSFGFFSGQMGQLTQQMQAGVQSDLNAAKATISGGQADVQNDTAAAQRESQAIPGLRAQVDQAQAGLNATMPRYNAAANELQQAKSNLNAANFVAGTAHGNEASALQANQDAQARLDQAKARIAQADNIINNQAPADPDATPANQAPADPDAAPAAGQAPADPDNNPNAVRDNALQAKASAQQDAAAASQDVQSTYDAWAQAHDARLGVDATLGMAQASYDQVAGEFNQADAIRGQAAAVLQNAQNNLSGHEQALGQDQQAVQNGNAQIAAGQAALAKADQLSAQASQYMTTLNGVKSMGNLDAQRAALQSAAHGMSGLAVNGGLQQSLAKQQTLLGDMAKPLPPAGYHQASPVVISEQ